MVQSSPSNHRKCGVHSDIMALLIRGRKRKTSEFLIYSDTRLYSPDSVISWNFMKQLKKAIQFWKNNQRFS